MEPLDEVVAVIREKAYEAFPAAGSLPGDPMETTPHPSMDALVLADVIFGDTPAKTANGLVRYSRRYRVLGVIDSTKAGTTADRVVEGAQTGIPVFPSLDEALEMLGMMKDGRVVAAGMTLINGASPVGGRLPASLRAQLLQAVKYGMDVVNTVHEKLSEDDEFSLAARASGATIHEMRREPPFEELHKFTDSVKDLACYRVALLGTDSCIGKRTAAVRLWRELNAAGVRTSLVATGQTGLLQGFPGIPLDAIRGDYVVGHLEGTIIDTFVKERPLVMLVEGQGALGHPVYVMGSHAILAALRPQGVVLVHDRDRKVRNFGRDDLRLPMPKVEDEVKLIRDHGYEVIHVLERGV